MLLADDFFLIAHDDRDGKSRLSQRAVEFGLAGAMLGELVLEQRILCEGPRLRVISREPPSDPLAHTNQASVRRLQQAIPALPPPLRDLILQVESAVGEAVLSQRG